MFVQDGFLYLIVTKHKLTVWASTQVAYCSHGPAHRQHTAVMGQHTGSILQSWASTQVDILYCSHGPAHRQTYCTVVIGPAHRQTYCSHGASTQADILYCSHGPAHRYIFKGQTQIVVMVIKKKSVDIKHNLRHTSQQYRSIPTSCNLALYVRQRRHLTKEVNWMLLHA